MFQVENLFTVLKAQASLVSHCSQLLLHYTLNRWSRSFLFYSACHCREESNYMCMCDSCSILEHKTMWAQDEPTALHSVGLCFFFGIVCERLSRWDSRSKASLEEPHVFIFVLGIHLGNKPDCSNPKSTLWESPDCKSTFESTPVSWLYPPDLIQKDMIKISSFANLSILYWYLIKTNPCRDCPVTVYWSFICLFLWSHAKLKSNEPQKIDMPLSHGLYSLVKFCNQSINNPPRRTPPLWLARTGGNDRTVHVTVQERHTELSLS